MLKVYHGHKIQELATPPCRNGTQVLLHVHVYIQINLKHGSAHNKLILKPPSGFDIVHQRPRLYTVPQALMLPIEAQIVSFRAPLLFLLLLFSRPRSGLQASLHLHVVEDANKNNDIYSVHI
jgi:hypothetical protein